MGVGDLSDALTMSANDIVRHTKSPMFDRDRWNDGVEMGTGVLEG